MKYLILSDLYRITGKVSFSVLLRTLLTGQGVLTGIAVAYVR